MSGTYPSSPGLSNVKIRSWSPTMVSQGHDLTRQVRSRGGQRWFIEGKLKKRMTRAVFAPVYAFLVAQRGQFETFTFVPPAPLCNTRGTAATATVSGASQTGRSVTISALVGTLKAGDFVKFDHNKVYMLTADAADAATSLSIEPALVASPADLSTVTVTSVPWTVACVTDFADIDISAPVFGAMKISFIEVP